MWVKQNGFHEFHSESLTAAANHSLSEDTKLKSDTFDQSTERLLVLKSSAQCRGWQSVREKSNCPRSADENKTHVKPAQTCLEGRGEGVSYSENIDF